ncbi:coiled-coil domain-containing protein 191 isoform X2 [Syngnathoides biaculeatus]|uniref:coiled-coil domain-containing protein 191 isoform X2 n=1 Tax=Syngnathoides biaculeatus TaxID=300417 RepID=UPI002ADDA7CA|nr:coiled-coil domain-containing protein 191 isoform X2 [Syngnathoides biaculeatus]
MDALPVPELHLLKCRKSIAKNSTTKQIASKKHVNKEDIDHWRKQVEKASEFALSEVFFPRRAHTGSKSLATALRSWEQLRDHDDAYAEAQALLGDWMDRTWKPELVTHGLTHDKGSPATPPPPGFNYNNFNDLYDHLAQEEENRAVDNFLRDLKEREVLDGGMMEKLASDGRETIRTFADPVITMEVRHQQVRENRALCEEEARRRRELEQEERKRQEATRRQQERVQQAIVRMRRQREERKGLEQRLRYREKMERLRAAKSLQAAPPSPAVQRRPSEENVERNEEKKVEIFVHLRNLKKYFSRWYSAVMEQRLRAGKAKALCDWRRQLGAWRAWRAAVWAGRNRREVSRTEETLRTENRQQQVAEESDRRRLLRRCLHEWQLWCRQERDQRELLAQQRETRRKMAALISAAASGQFKPPQIPTSDPSESAGKKPIIPRHRKTRAGPRPQPGTREEAVAAAEAQLGDDDDDADGAECDGDLTGPKAKSLHGSRFENRHAAQKKIIARQRRQLKEQQEEIAKLKRDKVMIAWDLKNAASRQAPRQSAPTEPAESDNPGAPQRQNLKPHTCPIISAMEERARVRAERKKQNEELKRVKEEEKQAEIKAAEEQKLREEEAEKAQKREERMLARMKKEEKLMQMKQQQQLLDRACQHYNRRVLRHRGLAPWKRLIGLKEANAELAESHHLASLLRRCALQWRRSAREALSEKEARADRLHRRFLLRRSLSYWKRLEDLRLRQEEQADVFCRARTLRRFLRALLDHMSQEKRLALEHEEMAEWHRERAAQRRCFQAWRLLPCLQRKEREREERRERLCRKVAEVLPTFWSRPL